MPTSITSSTGISYHLWQLPDLTTPNPEEDWTFVSLENDLSDGFYSQRIFGSNTGLRSWKLKAPTLASLTILPNRVTDINGASVPRLEYVRSLFAETQVTGSPFAYQSPITGQYYLVRFSENTLALARARVPIYASDLSLKQIRIDGETIFDVGATESSLVSQPLILYWLEGADFNNGTGTWTANTDKAGVGHGANVGRTGDVVRTPAAQNGLDVVQFNVTTNNGFVSDGFGFGPVNEFFIVMKMREATFSNNAGIFTGSGAADSQMLLGSSGTTKFANPGLTGFTYRLNGLEYAQSNMQAPMNTWGIVHLRYTTGWNTLSGLQFGKDRTTAGTFAEMDVGEIIVYNGVTPLMVSREITEYLTIKWGIT